MGIRVVELFAGVGGFRLGLERTNLPFETKWWNQWEPGSRAQHAAKCYIEHFHQNDALKAPSDANSDICQVNKSTIPNHDLLVGGFPCQDYSVATTLDKAGGIQGKKGVLWWEIEKILAAKKPRYVLLENVDRLLKSPAQQRGRDFGILLTCLQKHGYNVEWRIINAAEYGNAQRRRRVFIFGAHQSTGIGRHMRKHIPRADYLTTTGFFAAQFPINYAATTSKHEPATGTLPSNILEASNTFAASFQNAGAMTAGKYWTHRLEPQAEPPVALANLLEKGALDELQFLDPQKRTAWDRVKGPKKEKRKARNGFEYYYTEGGMQFPDLIDSPARTILTSEGNRTANRSTHVITDPASGRLRFLTPLEVERLNGFDDDWTANLPRRWRYFTMGNALVVPLVSRMGAQLAAWVQAHEPKATKKRLLNEEHEEVRSEIRRNPKPRTRAVHPKK